MINLMGLMLAIQLLKIFTDKDAVYPPNQSHEIERFYALSILRANRLMAWAWHKDTLAQYDT